MAQNYGQTYGRWVVRAAMEKGAGYGPAILLWPDSEKWPEDGEIDIVEMPRGDRSRALMTAHYGKNNDQHSHGVPGDFTQWHTYAIDWLPDRIIFYIDGAAIRNHRPNSNSHHASSSCYPERRGRVRLIYWLP